MFALRPTGRRRGGLAGLVDRARERAQAGIAHGLPPPAAALARGMVLGQDELIDEAVRDEFRASGLAHVLAVSGQNVMLLAALALPLLAAAGVGHRARLAGTVVLIALYVPLAGAGPSLQRAGVMGAASLIALAAARPASRWYALLLAACVTLGVNPRACGDPGWQLSFAAVAGILALAPLLRRPLAPLPRPLAEGIAVTVAATLSTAPLMAHHFGTVSLAGLPANVLALPLVAPIMWLGMVRAALAQLGPVARPIIDLAGLPLAPLLAALSGLATSFAGMPGGQLGLPLRAPGAVVLAYAVAGATITAIVRVAVRLDPAPRGRPLAPGPARPARRGRGRRGRAGGARAGAPDRAAGAAQRVHRLLPRRRPGRRNAGPGARRRGHPVRRRPTRGGGRPPAAQGRCARPGAGGGHPPVTRPPRGAPTGGRAPPGAHPAPERRRHPRPHLRPGSRDGAGAGSTGDRAAPGADAGGGAR